MATKTAPKKATMFDRMKGIEEKKKRATIVKILSKLKENARIVQEYKELCEILLEEVTSDPKERKQIIDWINGLGDVQVDADRRKELKESVEEDLKEEKEKVEKKMDEEPEKFLEDLSLNRAQLMKADHNAFYSTSNTSGTAGRHLCATPTLNMASMSIGNSPEGIKMLDASAANPV